MGCRFMVIVLLISVANSCSFGFKGITIPTTVNTYFVDQFQNGAGNAPPDIGQRFSDLLKDRVTRNSRLNYSEDGPDIEFSGTVSTFTVTSVAPERLDSDAGLTEFGSTLNRLNISVQVDYIDNQNDEESWSQSFSFFEDFEATEILSDVQDELIENIFNQLTTDIFNKSFTNW